MPKQYISMVNKYLSFYYIIPVLMAFNMFINIISAGFMNLDVFNQLSLSIVLLISVYFSSIYHSIFSTQRIKTFLLAGLYLFSFVMGLILADGLVPRFHFAFTFTVILILWFHHSVQLNSLKRNPFLYAVLRMDSFRKKLYFLKRDDLSVLKFYPYSIEMEIAKQRFSYRPDILFGLLGFLLLGASFVISGILEFSTVFKWGLFLSFFVALLMICFYSCRSANQFKTGL